MEALTRPCICDLIVIFQKTNKDFGTETGGRRAPCHAAPRDGLTLMQKTVFRTRNKLLRRATVIAVVTLPSACQRRHRAVMEIVVPHAVEIGAAFAARQRHLRLLQSVLSDQKNRTGAGCLARRAPDCPDNVFLRLIADGVRGVETKSIEMKFLNPVTRVGDEKFANRRRIRAVEINHLAPLVSRPALQIIVRESAEIVSFRSEMVVNDVENHAQPQRVRAIDKLPQ